MFIEDIEKRILSDTNPFGIMIFCNKSLCRLLHMFFCTLPNCYISTKTYHASNINVFISMCEDSVTIPLYGAI